MERYESKHVQILHPARAVYGVLADFNHLTPVVGDKVEGWCATEDTCSFKVQGFTVNLQMIEKVEHKLIKVTGADGSPMDFTFWLQLVSAAETGGRRRPDCRKDRRRVQQFPCGHNDTEIKLIAHSATGQKQADTGNLRSVAFPTAANTIKP